MRMILTILSFFCWTGLSIADNRLLFDAVVNDQVVRLALDTGVGYSILFEQTARRINLQWTDPTPDVKTTRGRVATGLSEECRLRIGETITPFRFGVLDVPSYMRRDCDGVLAWANIRLNILQICANTSEFSLLPELPKDIGLWKKWDLREDNDILTIELPDTSGQGGAIVIDTGGDFGVALSEDRWKNWRDAHKEQKFILGAAYAPYSGLKVYEVFWAEKLTFGQFSISDVPVQQSFSGLELSATDHEATLGLFALTRMDVIVDGPNWVLYTRPISDPKPKYRYNRTAAVFVPENTNIEHLVAHVVEGGPAYEAGVRDGDILLKIADLDVTKWRTDPKILPLSRFWSRPAGTQLDLSLLRNGTPLQIKVELKEIFPQ